MSELLYFYKKKSAVSSGPVFGFSILGGPASVIYRSNIHFRADMNGFSKYSRYSCNSGRTHTTKIHYYTKALATDSLHVSIGLEVYSHVL